ncbi:MAG TPA: heme ABC exporter ATP-binding protein CcmA [Dehalococcoidales bacterium]|nr:heme ABC exporter ATP-binding protein CcmA [Dehalococcoidales bacterium]
MADEIKDVAPAQAIAVQELKKSFGHHLALNGVDFRVARGEAVVVFGPNGAGKTTLIKILATIMNPSSGRIFIDGMSAKDSAEKIRRRIGVITHQTFLYGTLTAYENLEFYGRLYDVPRRKERIHEVVETVGMTSRLHDRVGTLSRGMQQRLSIARSLLHKPPIMLLDEPETGLDQQALVVLREALRAEDGARRTVVLTTHNLERGLELGDRLLILARGRIVYEGVTASLDLAGLREAYHQSTGVKA